MKTINTLTSHSDAGGIYRLFNSESSKQELKDCGFDDKNYRTYTSATQVKFNSSNTDGLKNNFSKIIIGEDKFVWLFRWRVNKKNVRLSLKVLIIDDCQFGYDKYHEEPHYIYTVCR